MMIKIHYIGLLLILIVLTLGQTSFISPLVTDPTELDIDVNISTSGVTDTHQVSIQVVPAEYPILEWMQELPPLRKIHYSWAITNNGLFAEGMEEILYEYVRLTNACSISAQWAADTWIDRCVQVCKQVNLTNPKHLASIGLNYSPFHFRYPNNPGGDPPLGFPDEDGDGVEDIYQQELDRALLRFTMMKDQLAVANALHETNIEITAIFFDSENFRYTNSTTPASLVWNAAITEKYTAIQDITEGIFPSATKDWYGRGQFTMGACNFDPENAGNELEKDGWCWNSHHPRDYSSPGYSSNFRLYEPEGPEGERQLLQKTVEYAAEHGITVVNPWISLGSGYRPWRADTNESVKTWTFNWPHDLYYSYSIGGKIDNPWFGNRESRFGPWNAVKIGMFYPEPFGRTTDWGRHFVAYVRGAFNRDPILPN